MRKKQRILACMLLMLAGLLLICGNTAVALDETTLFVTMDSAWEHAHEGDSFVVRVDVKNIGEHPALITWVRLENIPNDWTVQPPQNLILVLDPDKTQSSYFIVERGATDATIYATAQSYNAPAVQSNRIAIPIHLFVIVGFSLIGGVAVYRETRGRRKQRK